MIINNYYINSNRYSSIGISQSDISLDPKPHYISNQYIVHESDLIIFQGVMGPIAKRFALCLFAHAHVVLHIFCDEFGGFEDSALVRAIAEGLIV